MKRNLTIRALAFMLTMLLVGFGTVAFASEANPAQEIDAAQGQAENQSVWLQGAGLTDDNHLLLVTPGETGPTCTVNFLNGQPNAETNAAIHTPAGTLIFTGLTDVTAPKALFGANSGIDWDSGYVLYNSYNSDNDDKGAFSPGVVIDMGAFAINGVTVTNAANAQAIGQVELLGSQIPILDLGKVGDFNLTGSPTAGTVIFEGDFCDATIIVNHAGKVIYNAENADLFVRDDSEVRDKDGKELKTCEGCRASNKDVKLRTCGHTLCDRCFFDVMGSNAHREPASCGVEGHFACHDGDHTMMLSCGHSACQGGDHTKLKCGHFACEAGDHQSMHPCNKHYACQAGDHSNRHPCGRHYACQAGTHNKRNCGHYECLAGDHSSLDCGHYACKEGNHTTKRECGHYACQKGDHVTILKCGHFECDTSKNHVAAPCKTYKHFLCDGFTHTSAACACKIKGHLDCDGKNHAKLSCDVHYACEIPEWQVELHAKCAHCGEGFCTSGHSSCDYCWVKYCASDKPYIPSKHGIGVCACVCGNNTWHTKLDCGHYECQAATGDHSALPCGDYACQIEVDSNHSVLPCGHYACKGGNHALLPCQVAAHGYVCTVTPDEQTKHALCGECGEPLCRLLAHGIGFCKCGGCGRTDAVHLMNNCGHYGCEDTPTGAHGRLPCWTHKACETAQAEWPEHEPCSLCSQPLCAGAHGADACVCGKCGSETVHTILPCGHYECEVAAGEDHSQCGGTNGCGGYMCDLQDHQWCSYCDHCRMCVGIDHGLCTLCNGPLCLGAHGQGICQ